MKEAMQSVWIGIWNLIEDGGDGLNMKKWDKLQRGAEIAWFSISHSHAKWDRKVVAAAPREIVRKWFRMTMRNFRTVMRNEIERLWLQHQGKLWESDFAWPCGIFAQSCETLQKNEIEVVGFSTSHHHARSLGARAKVHSLQIPWWRSIRKTSKMLPSVLFTLAYK